MSNDKEKAAGKNDEAKSKADAADGEAEASEKPAAKGRFAFLSGLLNLPRKTLLFVVAPSVLVVVLGAGAYFFLFAGGEEEVVAEGAHGEPGAHGEAGVHLEAAHPAFYDVPDILVNVSAGGEKPAFLKLSVSLELENEEAKAAIEPVIPRVVDQLQTYLRELRVEDLSGSAALFRLKEELLRRVNLAVEPTVVKDVLFREMIVQ